MSALQYYAPVETHFIPSRYVAQTFKVQVMWPARRRGSSQRFPVVYATDGNWAFDMLKGISHILQTHERDAPPYILVGIAYPSDSPRGGVLLRARDLTFEGYPAFDPKPPSFEDVPVAPEGTPVTHGGAAFREFIEHELIPFIDKTYPTLAGERTYFGHSGGGGFGLFTLFTRPALFNRYIVSSANLARQGEPDDFLLAAARKFVAEDRPPEGTKLYLSVGEAEEHEPGIERWQLTSTFHQLAALLKAANLPGLELTTEVFAGETHMTVWPMAFIHGIQSVFGVRDARRAPFAKA